MKIFSATLALAAAVLVGQANAGPRIVYMTVTQTVTSCPTSAAPAKLTTSAVTKTVTTTVTSFVKTTTTTTTTVYAPSASSAPQPTKFNIVGGFCVTSEVSRVSSNLGLANGSPCVSYTLNSDGRITDPSGNYLGVMQDTNFVYTLNPRANYGGSISKNFVVQNGTISINNMVLSTCGQTSVVTYATNPALGCTPVHWLPSN